MRWPLAPAVLPGESASSWLCRCALAHGTDPVRFAATLWPHTYAWSRDMDHPTETQRRTLERGGSSNDLSAFPEDPRWVVPAAARGRSRIGRTPFCPRCWATDRTPYYRIAWRFAWNVACERHRTMLLDRCPWCDAALSPHLLPAGEPTLAICHHCGSDLRQSRTKISHAGAIALQARAQAAYDGNGAWWGWPLSRTAWLATLRFWIAFARCGMRSYRSPVTAFTEKIAPQLRQAGWKKFAELPVADRAQLFTTLAALPSLEPASALKDARSAGLLQHHVRAWANEVEPAAAWVNALPERYPLTHRGPRASRYRLGLPRPRSQVATMCQSLERAPRRAR